MALEEWEIFERHCCDLLGLSATLASGSQWHDIGDGVDRDSRGVWPIIMDAKSTVRGSYSLQAKYLQSWLEKAMVRNKRFVLPIRFVYPGGLRHHQDWAVLPLDDLAELIELAKRGSSDG